MKRLLLFLTAPLAMMAQAPSIADSVIFKDNRTATNTALSSLYGKTAKHVYCTDATGSTLIYTCPSPTDPPTSYTNLLVSFKPQTTNSGSFTINVGGLGAKTAKQSDGSTNMSASAVTGGSTYLFAYDGTNLVQVSSGGSSSSSATTLATGTGATLTAPRQYYVCTTTCTVTPPVPAAGYEFCVLNTNNVATVITMAAIGSSAMYQNTLGTAYGTAGTGTLISAGAVGDRVCLLGLDSTHYLTSSYVGTWTVN